MEEQRSNKKRRHNDDEAAKEQGKRTKFDNKDDLDRYTIGWVCALPKEQTAARAILDEEFRDVHIRKATNDTNTYILGSVGSHNIVIACLPKGQLGIVRASKVATSMTSTFRNIKFVLMVGIGGGVPSERNDVRLGDVVVSTPTGQYPGVVQWDFGKTNDGKFERTGSLNKPPTFLLTAISKMESNHEMEGSKIQENLDTMFNKWPRLKAKYARSDKLKDFLFSANYNHIDHPNPRLTIGAGENQESLQSGVDCLYCDPSKARKREIAGSVVHYGLIASGNQVIKDATYRDQINKNLNGNALCIEMEAAGLIDDFPCLVIRGISDYADSHKNNMWQEHAAAVAAALTKELLENVQPVEVESERTVLEKIARSLQENLADIQSTTLASKSEITKLGVQAKRGEDETVLQWLTPVEYGLQQSDFLRRKQSGTGEWFLKSETYRTWLNSKPKSNHRTLFCPGIPGAGKTILMSAVVDDITRRFVPSEMTMTAYVYCNFRRKEVQTVEHFLSSLIKQTARALAQIPDSVTKLYQDNKRSGTIPSALDLSDVFSSILGSFSTVFVLVDALDECDAESRFALLSILVDLQKKTPATLKLFFTSRPVPEIEGRFHDALICEIRAASEDIHRYVRHRLFQIPVCITDILEDRITNEIATAVDGMFLLAQLYLESLKDTTCTREILSALDRFKRKSFDNVGNKQQLSHVYDQAYEEAMERIRSQTQNRRDLGTRVISWITHATRPLTAEELQDALAVAKDHEDLDHDNFRDVKVMVSVCAGLVTVEDTSNVIRLVHYTTQEYFERTREKYFPDNHIMISSICVKYICFVYGKVNSLHVSTGKPRRPFFLFSYASYGWGYHAARGRFLCKDVERFLLRQDGLFESFSSFIPQSESSLKTPISGVGWAAYHGIDNAIDLFLRHQVPVDTPDSSENTPMVYAVMEGKANFAKLLFQSGADLSHPSQHELLHAVSRSANTNVMEVLLDHGAEIGREDSNRRTPLITAVIANQPSAVLLLLKKGVDINASGKGGRTPLHEAADFDRLNIAKILLGNGAYVDPQDEKGQTPLSIVARASNMDLAKLLLDNGALLNAGSGFGKAPLQVARHDRMIHFLITQGTSTSSANTNHECQLYVSCHRGDTVKVRQLIVTGLRNKPIHGYQLESALILAVRYQHRAIAKLLIEKTLEIDHFSTTQHQLALVHAIETGDRTTAIHLIQKGVGINEVQEHRVLPKQKSALVSALLNGYTDIATMLIEGGTNIHGIQGLQGQTPLFSALDLGYPGIASLLIEKGANVNGGQGPRGATALFSAIGDQRSDIVKLLLEKGAEVNGIQGPGEKSPLSRALHYHSYDIARLLILHGADVKDFQGSQGTTVLSSAIYHHQYDIIELMLQRGANAKSDANLVAACECGHLGILTLLLDYGADVNCSNALTTACLKKRLTCVKILLERGANANNAKALLVSCERDDTDYLKLLLDSGADVNNTKLLPAACRSNNLNGVKLLLERGAKANNKQALLISCKSGNVDIMELLLDSGADANNFEALPAACQSNSINSVNLLLERGADARNSEALIVSCRRSSLDIVELLIISGASAADRRAFVAACVRNSSRIVRFLLSRGADANNPEALTAACQHNADTVKVLLDAGADAENRDALTRACSQGFLDVTALLLDAGANADNEMALRNACAEGHFHIVDLLLRMGASPNDSAALTLAYNKDILKLLLDRGMNTTTAVVKNAALLHYCRHSRFPNAAEKIKLLLESGADVQAVDAHGRTGLFGCDSIVAQLLIDSGGDVSLEDRDDQTALFKCDASTAEVLINNGVNIEARDSSGKTALLRECSDICPRLDKIKLLIERGANINATGFDGLNAVASTCMRVTQSAGMEGNRVELLGLLVHAGGRLPEDADIAARVISSLETEIEKDLGRIPWWQTLELTPCEELLQILKAENISPLS